MTSDFKMKLRQPCTAEELLNRVRELNLGLGEPYLASVGPWEMAAKTGNFLIVFPAVSHRYQVQISPETAVFKIEHDENGKVLFPKLAIRVGSELKAKMSDTMTQNLGKQVADDAAGGALRSVLPVGGLAGGAIMRGIAKAQPDYKKAMEDLAMVCKVIGSQPW